MMEPSEHEETNAMEDNLRGMTVSDVSVEDDAGLSRIRVNVRRQDSSIDKGVNLGIFGN